MEGQEFKRTVSALKRKLGDSAKEVQSINEKGRASLNDPSQVTTFKGMFKVLEKYYSKFETYWDELVDLHEDENKTAEFPITTDVTLQTKTKRYYYEAHSSYETLMAQTLPSRQSIDPNQSLVVSPETRSNKILPRINLPHFNGQITNWPKFRDAFTSIIHNDALLSKMEKFHYLVSSLVGTATAVINNLPLVEDNYELAWKALNDTFNNKRMLASNYLNQLIGFKPQQGKPTIDSLQTFVSQVSDNIAAFKLLKIPKEADFVLFHIAVRLLDPVTREQFELAHKEKDFPLFDDLTKFIRERCLALQLAHQSSHEIKSTSSTTLPKASGFRSSARGMRTILLANAQVKDKSYACFICNSDGHTLPKCNKFMNASVEERLQMLKNWRGCKNCLYSNHVTGKCTSKWNCRVCKKRHHSLLHLPTSSDEEAKDNIPASILTATLPRHSNILLGTVVAEIRDSLGRFQTVRLVVDSGSQHSFITQKCVTKLGLSSTPFPKKISAIGQTIFDGAKGKALCYLKPRQQQAPILNTEAVIIKNITSYLPNFTMPSRLWPQYAKFELADPKFWEPGPVDFLLGSDLFPDIWTGPSITLQENQPKLLASIFGYIAIGRVSDCLSSSTVDTSFFTLTDDSYDLHTQLKCFWELEEPAPIPTKGNPEDLACESHFTKTHYRLDNGQYVVRLPFKDEQPELGGSERSSLKRLYCLERKLAKIQPLKTEYSNFMQEYLELGHMSPTSSSSKYVIPHHSVTKEDRSQIKLRVVFDASAPTDSNSSLNNHLMTGPKLQQDIRSILTRFRMYPIVFVADLIKMYRQILIDPRDRAYQHIFWRFDPSEAIKKYELNTVTYGTASAPFLALRVIKQLTTDEGSNYPKAAKVIAQDMYVDDLVTGASSVDEAIELKEQVIGLLNQGSFQLSKWASNSPEILQSIDPSKQSDKISLIYSEDQNVKILGLQWNPSSDTFTYKLEKFIPVFTKRAILSAVAKIYDPLGFLSPVIFFCKSIIQSLWKLDIDWDSEIPTNLMIQWKYLVDQFDKLETISIARFVATEQPYQLQIVGFSDASEKGYCATIYLRVISDHIRVHLLTAKTKLAPIKTLSIPRLELCGAYLLAKLFCSTMETFSPCSNSEFLDPVFFTDSSIVLGWLNTPTYKLKVFVANRVAYITDHTRISFWKHVKSEENPSDLGSRGLSPENLINNQLWWHGTKWLSTHENDWPVSNIQYEQPLPETKVEAQTLISNSFESEFVKLMENHSSYLKLLRVMSWTRRFAFNAKAKVHKTIPHEGPIQSKEFKLTLFFCVKIIQSHYLFGNTQKKCDDVKTRFHKLSPFFDKLGILRVGGRLNKANISEDQRHPIILPKCHFTLLLVDYYHKIYLHPGPSLLQALIQLRFWIPSLRNIVRQRTFKCLKCYKLRAGTLTPQMADLPSPRVNISRAFLHVGADFAGPLILRESLRRKAATSKTYICVFVCLATKALHLELVTALSTDAFMAAFQRFISRRGLPEQMYSDCGTNFKGAANRLREFGLWYTNKATQEDIAQNISKFEVQWNFNPPHSPHFGGLWEAAVKSAKTHLRKVAGETSLTYEEWATLLTQVEAVLNSRPLCPLSASPEETNFLSPGHFLIGCPLVAPPEPSLLDLRENTLSRWQLVQKMTQDFWKRWRVEYLNTLQSRSKWTKPSSNPKIGDLVLLKDQNLPVLQWPLARIIKTHPGTDGVIRVVTVKTKDSEFQRPAVKLVPLLPLSSDFFD